MAPFANNVLCNGAATVSTPESRSPHQAWSPPTRYIVALLSIIAALALVIYARELFAALSIAALVTYLLNPLVVLLRRRTRLSHSAAANIVFGLVLLLLATGLATSTPLLLTRLGELPDELNRLTADVEASLGPAPALFGIPLPVHEWLDSVRIDTALLLVPEDVIGVLSNVSQNLAWVLVTFMTTYYLLHDWFRLRNWVIMQAPDFRRSDFIRLYVEVQFVWQAYVRGQLTLSLMVGLATWIACAAVGLRGAWAIGLLAGVLDIIPQVGPLLATAVGLIVAATTGSLFLPIPNVWFVLIVLLIFTVVQVTENIWWRPRVLGNSLRMHPALVFVGVLASLSLAGVYLTLFIVPIMATVGVFWQYGRARMLGIDPWPDSPITRPRALATDALLIEVGERSGQRTLA